MKNLFGHGEAANKHDLQGLKLRKNLKTTLQGWSIFEFASKHLEKVIHHSGAANWWPFDLMAVFFPLSKLIKPKGLELQVYSADISRQRNNSCDQPRQGSLPCDKWDEI